MNKLLKSDYQSFVMEIKEKIHESQLKAMQAVNRELLGLYTDIGRSIVEKQKNFGWGKSVVDNLSRDLQIEFPGTRGFSADNLWRMRKFYLIYKDNEKLAPLVQEIGWSHNIIVLEKCICTILQCPSLFSRTPVQRTFSQLAGLPSHSLISFNMQ